MAEPRTSFLKRLLPPNRSGTSALLIGKVSTTAAHGVVLIILARMEGASAVGLYTLALALISPIFIFGHLRLQDRVATDPQIRDRWGSYRGAMVLGTVIAYAVAVAVSIAYPNSQILGVSLALAVSRSAESYSRMVHGYWQGSGQFLWVARSNIIRAIGLVVATIFGISVVGGVIGAVVTAAVVSVGLVPLLERTTPHADEFVSIAALRTFTALIPLGATAVLVALNQTIVRLVIDRSLGVAELGVFAATAYLIRAGAIVAQALGQSRSPQLRKAAAQQDHVRVANLGIRSALYAAVFGTLVAAIMIAGGPQLLMLVFGADFVASRALIASVFLAGIPLFAATALSVAVVALNRHRLYLLVMTGSVLVTLLAVITFTPMYGVVGAGLGWALGETTGAAILLGFMIMRRNGGASS